MMTSKLVYVDLKNSTSRKQIQHLHAFVIASKRQFLAVMCAMAAATCEVDESLRQRRDTIPVMQTISGIKCRDDDRCNDDDHSGFYCYVDSSRWEDCCGGGCGNRDWSTDETFCKNRNGGGWSSRRCRRQPLAITLQGRPCAAGEYCGFYGQSYQWCWISEDHKTWDYCCFPGYPCEKNGVYNDDYVIDHYINGCYACKETRESCGGRCSKTICQKRLHACNPRPIWRSLNNYACASACNYDNTRYSWCWLDEEKTIWDWCCSVGETCDVVKPGDVIDNASTCYTKLFQQWPMECRVGEEVTPLPAGYESPPTPLEGEEIAGIVCGITLPILITLFIYWICRRNKKLKEKRMNNQYRLTQRN